MHFLQTGDGHAARTRAGAMGIATAGLIALAVAMALAADLFLLPGLIRWSLR